MNPRLKIGDVVKRGKEKAERLLHDFTDRGGKIWDRSRPAIKEAGRDFVEQGRDTTGYIGKQIGKVWRHNKPALIEARKNVQDAAIEFTQSTGHSVKEGLWGVVDRVKYSRGKLDRLQNLIKYQGGYYRELNRGKRTTDCVMLGGESLAVLIASTHIPEHIQAAYEAAYPKISAEIGLGEKLSELKDNELLGFLSGVKGKLFEQQYVEYLNAGNLPDGYSAVLAEASNQPGWDIRIEGSNTEIVELLQAKATDSVGYVVTALEKNPEIDVVTTEEVYAHLVMSGVSEGITNSGISNASLEASLDDAVDAANINMSFSPPWFTLALIAFTSYKDESSNPLPESEVRW